MFFAYGVNVLLFRLIFPKRGFIMELIIILTVILVLALILGVSASAVITGVMLLLILSLVFIVCFFSVCAVWLAGSKKYSGTLSRVDKNPKFKYNSAYYNINGEEFPNVFPCEVILKKYLYKPDRNCVLRLNRKKKVVFDGNAYACVIAGLVLGLSSLVMVTSITAYFIRGGIF